MSDIPFVLIHGAWHDASSWEKVAPLLQKKGFQVFCPNLPGRAGDGKNFCSIHLSTYVDSVCELIDHLDKKVCLVGHSMGGMTITQVAERCPEKIERLVYVAAFLPQNGQSMLQLAQSFEPTIVAKNLQVDLLQCQILINKNIVKEAFYNDCSEEDQQKGILKIIPEPFLPMNDQVHSTDENFGQIPRLYIECTNDQSILASSQQKMYAQIPCVVKKLSSGHCPNYSMPEALCELLVSQ